jgi:hypothetical protein
MPNRLLNQAAPIGAPSIPTHQESAMSEKKKGEDYPQCLYRGDAARMVADDAEAKSAKKSGWVDHPDKAAAADKEKAK